jgi:hypothetical protein
MPPVPPAAAHQSGEPLTECSKLLLALIGPLALSMLVTVMLSDPGESEMVRLLNIPLISRRSSEIWSFGAVDRSRMKSLIDRIIGGHDSSLGNHQSDGAMPQDSSMRFRITSGKMYLVAVLVSQIKPCCTPQTRLPGSSKCLPPTRVIRF